MRDEMVNFTKFGHKYCFPNVTYSSAIAKRRLLHLPLAAITIGKSSSGVAEVYLLEAYKGLNYSKLIEFIESKVTSTSQFSLTKDNIKNLLTLAQSNREREVIRHVIFQTSDLSATAACKQCGWENMKERSAAVEKYLKDASDIRNAIEDLAMTQERAVLQCHGTEDVFTSSSSELEDEDSTVENEDSSSGHSLSELIPDNTEMNSILVKLQFNWYEFVAQILDCCKCEKDADKEDEIIIYLEKYFSYAM